MSSPFVSRNFFSDLFKGLTKKDLTDNVKLPSLWQGSFTNQKKLSDHDKVIEEIQNVLDERRRAVCHTRLNT
jgi:hypothetical protein